ncbi:unnamed protein product [Gadus morhua 'NCC']
MPYLHAPTCPPDWGDHQQSGAERESTAPAFYRRHWAEGEGSRSQGEGFVFLRTETHVLEALIQAQMKAVEGSKRIQRFPVNGSKPKALERDVTEMDPALRLMLQEKERAVRTLQETG